MGQMATVGLSTAGGLLRLINASVKVLFILNGISLQDDFAKG